MNLCFVVGKSKVGKKIGEEDGDFKKWYRRLKGVRNPFRFSLSPPRPLTTSLCQVFWGIVGLYVMQRAELMRVILDEPAVDRCVLGRTTFHRFCCVPACIDVFPGNWWRQAGCTMCTRPTATLCPASVLDGVHDMR